MRIIRGLLFSVGLIWKLQFLRDPGLLPEWKIHGDIILVIILVLWGFSIHGFCSPLLPKGACVLDLMNCNLDYEVIEFF